MKKTSVVCGRGQRKGENRSIREEGKQISVPGSKKGEEKAEGNEQPPQISGKAEGLSHFIYEEPLLLKYEEGERRNHLTGQSGLGSSHHRGIILTREEKKRSEASGRASNREKRRGRSLNTAEKGNPADRNSEKSASSVELEIAIVPERGGGKIG